MKKLIVLGFVLLLILVPASLFASSCESAGAEYYINFTVHGVEVDDVEYSCVFGATDIDTGDPYAAVQPEDATYLMGITEQVTFNEIPTGDYACVKCYLRAISEGTYTRSEGEFGLTIDIIDGGEPNNYGTTSGTIIITSFGEVGETVEGSFDLHVQSFGIINFIPLLEYEYDVTGSFRVKRIEYLYD